MGASVFWNLKTRYQAKMIHTYSGLFVVVVNPYKRYPLYTHRVCKIYLGKRRNEAPPHLWAIAEGAYRNMLQNTKNNAMLITGESGAGKTENTKKVITYLAMVATGSGKKVEKKVSLEDQIVATNPILESYGNAKTARSDNYDYIYVSQGKTSVASIDDNEELEYTEDAFTVLGFEDWEKFDCYVLTAGVMTCGGIQYIQKGRDEQAELSEIGPDTFVGKAAAAFGVDTAAMVKAFCKPRIKVGTEWVTKGQNIEQATGATGGIARSIFDRVFKWL